jgi:hypothetical protein
VPALERADGTHSLRPLNGVDRPAVETVLTQRDLEAGDLRVVRLSGGRERERAAKAAATVRVERRTCQKLAVER